MEGLVSNTPLITVSTKRLSAAAMCRVSSIALLDAGSGRYSPLPAGTASRIFLVVALSLFNVPKYRSCSKKVAWSAVIVSAIALLLIAFRVFWRTGLSFKRPGVQRQVGCARQVFVVQMRG